MAALLVTYDLHQPGRDYTAVDTYLQGHPSYWRFLASAWVIVTASPPDQVRDQLVRLVDANDQVFVVDISRCGAAWRGFAPNDDWLKNAIMTG